MRLFYNPPSPYSRAVLVVMHERNLADRVELCRVDPWHDPPELREATPLGKVPTLVTDDDLVLTESILIGEYLDRSRADSSPADDGEAAAADRIARIGLAHGLMDVAFASVIERRRPPELQWAARVERQHRAIERTLPLLETRHDRFDLGDMTLACALSYLDFRLPEFGWRTQHAHLGEWLDTVSERPSMQATRP